MTGRGSWTAWTSMTGSAGWSGFDDAAFLGMDLERLGAPALAEEFMAAYADYCGDPAPASLSHHYVAYRAGTAAYQGPAGMGADRPGPGR